jgi:hypothetical protein
MEDKRMTKHDDTRPVDLSVFTVRSERDREQPEYWLVRAHTAYGRKCLDGWNRWQQQCRDGGKDMPEWTPQADGAYLVQYQDPTLVEFVERAVTDFGLEVATNGRQPCQPRTGAKPAIPDDLTNKRDKHMTIEEHQLATDDEKARADVHHWVEHGGPDKMRPTREAFEYLWLNDAIALIPTVDGDYRAKALPLTPARAATLAELGLLDHLLPRAKKCQRVKRRGQRNR